MKQLALIFFAFFLSSLLFAQEPATKHPAQVTKTEKKVEVKDTTVTVKKSEIKSKAKPSSQKIKKDTTDKKQKQKEVMVLICNSSRAYAYHSHECRGLARCKAGISKVALSEAKRRGYSPCKICY
ncbi:MAG: hypothetical protein CVU66_00720 [Deltaproteobacteria bacterium HGW-Deltaproteobacteria-23]|nr:MAG: hypothetical protein CVU66_00720 [Deltaproteobacteria bacterium HGW-Deltaproteobacteria-23]